eukprot:7070199-Prymnesium_polylepis.1
MSPSTTAWSSLPTSLLWAPAPTRSAWSAAPSRSGRRTVTARALERESARAGRWWVVRCAHGWCVRVGWGRRALRALTDDRVVLHRVVAGVGCLMHGNGDAYQKWRLLRLVQSTGADLARSADADAARAGAALLRLAAARMPKGWLGQAADWAAHAWAGLFARLGRRRPGAGGGSALDVGGSTSRNL